jgi:integrase
MLSQMIYQSPGTGYYAQENHRNPRRLMEPAFLNFVEDYIFRCRKSDAAKELYNQTLFHLKKFCYTNGIEPRAYDFGLRLTDEFVLYLERCGLMSSTVGSHLQRLKTLLKVASYHNMPIDYSHTDVKIKEDPLDVVFLDYSEIALVYSCQALTKREIPIRDLFVIECMTGLRYSDATRLNEDNFVDGKICIKTKKTGAPVVIPQAKFVREILKKYQYHLPDPVSSQHFNAVIKKICCKAKIDSPILYSRVVGGKRQEKYMEKWERVSSHTGRRSAANNMFLMGIPPLRIMQITGHKTEAAFMRYIGMSRDENAAVLASNQFFR